MEDWPFRTMDAIEVELREPDGRTRHGLVGNMVDASGNTVMFGEVALHPSGDFCSVGAVDRVSTRRTSKTSGLSQLEEYTDSAASDGFDFGGTRVSPAQSRLALNRLPKPVSALLPGDHVFVHDTPSPGSRTIEARVASTESFGLVEAHRGLIEVNGGRYVRSDGHNIGAADTTMITSATALDGSQLRTGRDWAKENDITVLDPDGWRRPDGRTLDDPISEVDFANRVMISTVQVDDPRAMERLVDLLDEHGLNEPTGEMSSHGPFVVDPLNETTGAPGWGREVPLVDAQLREDHLEKMRDCFTEQLEELEEYIGELNPHNPEMQPKIDGGRRALEHGRQMIAELEEPMSGRRGVDLETLTQVSNRTDTYLEKIGARPQQPVPDRRGAGVDVPLEDQPIIDDDQPEL